MTRIDSAVTATVGGGHSHFVALDAESMGYQGEAVRRVRTSGRVAPLWLALLVAASGVLSCSQQVSGSPVAASEALAVDLDTALLDGGDVDDVIGTSGAEVQDEGDAPDDTIDVDPAECHGVVYIAGEIEYASTDFTAMKWRIVGTDDMGIVEMVAELPSAAKADAFIDEQATAWQGCAGTVIISTDKASGAISKDRVTAVSSRPNLVVLSSVTAANGRPCQHVLQAVSNVVLDVSVCGTGVSDQAETIASEIADRVQTG